MKKVRLLLLSLFTSLSFCASAFVINTSVRNYNDNPIQEVKAEEEGRKIYVRLNSDWCLKNNNLDTEDWGGGDGHLYACFYSEMPSNPDDKITTNILPEGTSWPGTQMATTNRNGVFAFASAIVPDGAVAVCFNSGDTGTNTHCRVQVKEIPTVESGNDCFFVDTNYVDWNPFHMYYCQNGSWGALASNKDAFIIGSGSFSETPEWETTSGIKLGYYEGTNGAIFNQYFEKDDIFYIVNEDDDKFKYDNITSGSSSYVSRTALNEKDGKITCSIMIDDTDGNVRWWRKDGLKICIVTAGSSISRHNEEIHILDVGTPGLAERFEFEIYTDITSVTFYPINDQGVNPTSKSFTDSNLSGLSSDPRAWRVYYSGGWFGSDQLDYTTKEEGKNIVFNQSGYYDIELTSENKIDIKGCNTFIPGEAVYLDVTNASSYWIKDSTDIYAYFYDSAETDEINVPGGEVHCHGLGKTIYEFDVPILSNGDIPDRLVFYTVTKSTGEEEYSSFELTYDYSSNIYVLTGSKYIDVYFYGSWSGLISNEQRVSYYGKYFNQQVVCDGEGSITTDNWGLAEEEYEQTCSNVKGIIFKALANQHGNDIEKALSKYDYIIDKYAELGIYNDFIGRNEPGSGKVSSAFHGHVNPLNFLGLKDDNMSVIIIVIASSVSLISVTALSVLVVRKRKTKK